MGTILDGFRSHSDRCASCAIRHANTCGVFPVSDLHVLEEFKLKERFYGAGTDLYHQGAKVDCLFNLLEGWVAVYRIAVNGRRQILDFLLPGALIGYQSDLSAPMRQGAACITDVRLCVFPRRAFPHFVRKHPHMMERLLDTCAEAEARAHDAISNIGSQPAERRVIHLLTALSVRVLGTSRSLGDQTVYLPLNLDLIADALGLTSVYVSRILCDLKKRGILHFRNKHLTIQDYAKLAELAGLRADELRGWPAPCSASA